MARQLGAAAPVEGGMGGEHQRRRSAASRRGGRGAEEGENPLYLQAVVASLKDAADKERAEEDEAAQAITAIKEMEAREAAGNATVIILDD